MAQQGDYFGSYRLLGRAGNGRQCQVWEAMHDARQDRYALKIVNDNYRQDSQLLKLMKHELEVGKDLKHPAVIRVFEFDASRQSPFLALEFFGSAMNLKQVVIQGGDRLASQTQKILEQTAEGLSYFHQQGWIHRDIKPDNFLVNPDGAAKLIDFAIAVRQPGFFGRLLGSKPKVQGTRSYMSPEQIRHQVLDARSDIYSFGCVTFEVLCGRPPFTGNSENELLKKHLNSPPPPIEASNKNVTSQCIQLVKRMLAKNPADRPATMGEVLVELRAAKALQPGRPAPKR